MLTTIVPVLLSFVSSGVLYGLPRTDTQPDVRSSWVSWAILLVLCLIMRRRSTNLERQQYELVESPRRRDSIQSTNRGFLSASMPAMAPMAVAAGLLGSTQFAQSGLPVLVIITSVMFSLEQPEEQSLSLDSKADAPPKKYSKSWTAVRLTYIGLMSAWVWMVLYQNTKTSGDTSNTLIYGIAFLLCLSGVYLVLTRLGSTKGQNYGAEQSVTLVDWHLASRISIQALCMVSVLLMLAPSSSATITETLVFGFVQVVQWISIYQLATSGSSMASSTSQLAALGIAQVLLPDGAANAIAGGFVFTTAVVIGLIGSPLSDRMPGWATYLLMSFPLLPLAASTLELSISKSRLHPIEKLYLEGKRHHAQVVAKQSKTPKQASIEYRRRYGREPPPGFEKWVNLALKKDFVLIDEFDLMMSAFEPFYQVTPSDLAKTLASTPLDTKSLVEFKIENAEIEYQRDKPGTYFAEYFYKWLHADPDYLDILPNVTILLNSYDEPKVVMPHEMLTGGPEAFHRATKADFKDLTGQHAWHDMTLSCPETSAARTNNSVVTRKATEFVSDFNYYQDVCKHREYENLHAFLNRPATMQLTQSPLPIWTQARPSSFQDLLFPSPYYEKHRRDYNISLDSAWEDKENSVYWAGSTTGGTNTADNWNLGHRQRMVMQTMPQFGPRNISLLEQDTPQSAWREVSASSTSHENLIDLHIGKIVQCDEVAAEKLEQAFSHRGNQPMSASYAHKYVLDMDGNGFSGRYYRLLRSHSAVIKQTIFKEWHDDWLVPWVHFLPLSMEGTEIWEMMRFLATTERGEEIGVDIAKTSSEWAEKTLRPVDMELVLLRLILEHGRLYNRTD